MLVLISDQACEILTKLFPEWVPLSTNQEPCPICEAYIHNSKEDKRELRKKAEDEKVNVSAYRSTDLLLVFHFVGLLLTLNRDDYDICMIMH